MVGSQKISKSGGWGIAPVLEYGTGRPNCRLWFVFLLLFLILLGAIAGWWKRDTIRQWNADRLVRREIRTEFDKDLTQASAAIAAEHWADAQIEIDRARLAASADPNVFREGELEKFARKLDDIQSRLQSRLGQAQERYARLHPASDQPKRVGCLFNISDLNNSAEELLQQGKYKEAQATAAQVLILDPQNERALTSLHKVQAHLADVNSPAPTTECTTSPPSQSKSAL